ncbi:hypothetical protein KP509_22G075700 [Ceratopteris richardii]|uniref:GST N-terminal domain-containing protein n=1 Tax=Ceratopteris richardii TaxID=49495 RepID=A0A8T2S6J9_CERRI|nr:hypothetical protein KP509_22G075700 [Ceratopteris richardii]
MKAIIAASSTTVPLATVSRHCHSPLNPSLPSISSALKYFPLSSRFAVAAPCSSLYYDRGFSRASVVKRSHLSTYMASAAVEPVEVLVKAATGEPEKLGDCPFSQRVLLTLEEKKVPYTLKLVDLSNKPDWFTEVNPEGKVPVIKHEGKWVPDSDVITQIIEEKFPEPPLQTPAEKASAGGKVFPCFVKFLKSKDSSDGTEEALVAELKSLNEHLKEHGPYIAGENVTAADLSLSPKLLHLKVALGHYKNWSIPSDLTYLLTYIETVHARESFTKTRAADEYIVAGWAKHLA